MSLVRVDRPRSLNAELAERFINVVAASEDAIVGCSIPAVIAQCKKVPVNPASISPCPPHRRGIPRSSQVIETCLSLHI